MAKRSNGCHPTLTALKRAAERLAQLTPKDEHVDWTATVRPVRRQLSAVDFVRRGFFGCWASLGNGTRSVPPPHI
ncbi:hypothetical protein TNCV_252531 [Trichonephila clavipes]|nr:hypothetical protein TNCV_252531 [Trichonephila clavipes]